MKVMPHGLFRLASAGALIAITLALAVIPAPAQDFRHGYNAFRRGDYVTAAQEWEPLAEAGDARSQNNLGMIYSHGILANRDYPLATYWYRRAAAQGDVHAFFNLGITYENGLGVDRNDKTALEWYLRAAETGLIEAMNAAAWVYATSPDDDLRDGRKAIRWAQSAVAGQANAKYLSTLAAAYAETGAFDKAIATIERAIEALDGEPASLDKDGGATKNAPDPTLLRHPSARRIELKILREHLELFRGGRPLRD